MKYLLTAVFLFFVMCTQVSAQADTATFHMRVFGTVDTTPPTTPTLLSVDPIASSQIDVSWSSSTDDFVLAGYTLLRDGTPIATTTQLSYSDTGLAPSSTYSYAVRAFDTSSNYSTTSNTLATTTPALPPPPSTPTSTPTSGSEGTVARVVTESLTVTPGIATTTIDLKTARPARIELRWGRTASYELGYIVRDVFTDEHLIELSELEPGTSYEYELIAYTPSGVETIVKRGSFTTENPTLSEVPANVAQFFAQPDGVDVRLQWQMPTDEEVAQVRIVRSHLGFPEYPNDGAIVYQGSRESAIDAGVLEQYSPVYYTAFVYDTDGNVSSGAIALVYASFAVNETDDRRGPDTPTDPIRDIGTTDPTEEATTTIDTGRVTPEMRMPDAADITLWQGGDIFTLEESDIALDITREYLIAVPVETIAGNLKSLIVTVVDPTNQRQRHSYLLRINKDRSAYEAVLPAMERVGQSRIVLEIYDYEAFVVAKYQAPLVFAEDVSEEPAVSDVTFPDVLFERSNALLLGIALLFTVSLVLLLVYRARGEDKD